MSWYYDDMSCYTSNHLPTCDNSKNDIIICQYDLYESLSNDTWINAENFPVVVSNIIGKELLFCYVI